MLQLAHNSSLNYNLWTELHFKFKIWFTNTLVQPDKFTVAFYLFISALLPCHLSALMHWESLVSKAHLIYAARVYISEQKQNLIPINYLLSWRLLKYISRKFTDLLISVHLICSFANGIFSRWIAVLFLYASYSV